VNRCNTGIHGVFSCEHPNGASASYSYDSTGKLTSLSHKAALGLPIDSFSYTHDKVGNRLSKKQLLQTINYSYDPLYRLTQARVPWT
jgi:hypothetical protein